MTETPQCFVCRHYVGPGDNPDELICTAFPFGIPREIIWNDFDHRNAHDGDHGIRFEPRSRSTSEDHVGLK